MPTISSIVGRAALSLLPYTFPIINHALSGFQPYPRTPSDLENGTIREYAGRYPPHLARLFQAMVIGAGYSIPAAAYAIHELVRKRAAGRVEEINLLTHTMSPRRGRLPGPKHPGKAQKPSNPPKNTAGLGKNDGNWSIPKGTFSESKLSQQMARAQAKRNRTPKVPYRNSGQIRGEAVRYHSGPKEHDQVSVTLIGTSDLTTVTTTGIVALDYDCGNGVTTSIKDIIPKLGVFYGMYDWNRFDFLEITFMPNVAYDATGYVAMAFDPNPRAAAPTSIAGVSRHLHSVVTDVKSPATLRITGRDLSRLGSAGPAWYASSTGAQNEWRCPANFQLYAATNQTDAATVLGQLRVRAICSFKGLNATD